MTAVKKAYIDKARYYSAPSGNAWKAEFKMTTVSGVVQDSDLATALQAADTVKIGVLPAGLRIHDALILIRDAFTATSTFTIGFAYVDGVDDSDVPQDADYFCAALDAATLARARASNTAVAPVTLPKDAYVVITNNTAAQDTDSEVIVIVEGIHTGHP